MSDYMKFEHSGELCCDECEEWNPSFHDCYHNGRKDIICKHEYHAYKCVDCRRVLCKVCALEEKPDAELDNTYVCKDCLEVRKREAENPTCQQCGTLTDCATGGCGSDDCTATNHGTFCHNCDVIACEKCCPDGSSCGNCK